MDTHPPHFTLEVENVDGQPLGYVVVDSFVRGTSSGGVRLVEDVDCEEIRRLAREMTLKFGFAGLRRGGAKAGVRISPDLDATTRRQALERFGEGIRPLVETGVYYPGRDMNCSFEDLAAIYRGAGFPLGPIADSSHYTALSVAAGVRAWERQSARAGRSTTLAIQGFGNVASSLVELLGPPGYRVVAVSTAYGARRSPDGFDPAALRSAWKESGARFTEHEDLGQYMSLEEVLAADVDVLVPAARTGAIGSHNVASIRAAAIVPAANAPYADGADVELERRGCVCLPGYVCNVGGVYGSSLEDRGVPASDIFRVTDEHFQPVMDALLARSAARGVSPIQLAESVAIARSRAMQATPDGRLQGLTRKLVRRGLFPRRVDGALFLRQFREELIQLEEQVREWTP